MKSRISKIGLTAALVVSALVTGGVAAGTAATASAAGHVTPQICQRSCK